MSISLTAEQRAWLAAHVARAEFPSIEAAARQLIDERIAERVIEEGDDFAWARPHVEVAQAEAMRGDVLSRAEHEARMDLLLASMKDG